MIDPKISSVVSGELQKDCIVVFDECHNMDQTCIESLTIHIDRKILQLAIKNIEKLKFMVDETKSKNSSKLQNEYNMLLKNLQDSALGNYKHLKSDLLAFRKIDDNEITNIMPGNIRKADHFLSFVRRVIINFLIIKIFVINVNFKTKFYRLFYLSKANSQTMNLKLFIQLILCII